MFLMMQVYSFLSFVAVPNNIKCLCDPCSGCNKSIPKTTTASATYCYMVIAVDQIGGFKRTAIPKYAVKTCCFFR